MDTQGLQGPRIALLIDFDNVILGVEEPPGFDIELVVNALRSRGVIVLGRAYGDWYRHNRHRRKLMDHGIELVETPAFGPIIKNSADIRIALDGFEIGMTQHHITEFCLVSGDSDFLPLIKRLQYLGKTVTVIAGIKFTSELVRRNCNEFISYENLVAESVGATEDATVLEGAFALLVRTISTLHERGMEVRSSTVKQMMIQLNPVFSERTFGCSQFKQFLDKGCRAGMIKLGRRDPNSGEYNVLLPGDFEDDVVAAEPFAPEPEKPRARTPRGRGRSARAAAPEADAEAGKPAEAEEPAAADGGESDGAAAREALRRGRLRSSGRTWRGTAGTRSVLQGAVNGAGPAAEESETTPAKTDDAVAKSESAAPAEPEATEAAEEKPQRTTRRRRKPAAKKEEAAEASGEASGEASPAETPVPEPGKNVSSESSEEKPAKKPTRRRAPRKKKEEGPKAE